MLHAPSPLTRAHQLQDFSSGVAVLDDWLRRRALANQTSGASRTFVVTEGPAPDMSRVVGYYALASGALASAEAPGRFRRNMPDPIPMAILGRLAVDTSWQGRGLGVALLRDAVLRVRAAASIMGIRGVLVHAISEEARRFYERHGFAGTPTTPMTLVLSLAEPMQPG
jgi:GNAT superfamily N-acetyltransferase